MKRIVFGLLGMVASYLVIRFRKEIYDFVGRIGYLSEIEFKYKLGVGIKVGDENRLLNQIEEWILTDGNKEIFQKRRDHLLKERIGPSKLIIDTIGTFISNSN